MTNIGFIGFLRFFFSTKIDLIEQGVLDTNAGKQLSEAATDV